MPVTEQARDDRQRSCLRALGQAARFERRIRRCSPQRCRVGQQILPRQIRQRPAPSCRAPVHQSLQLGRVRAPGMSRACRALPQEGHQCEMIVVGAKRVGVRMRVAETATALQPADQRGGQAVERDLLSGRRRRCLEAPRMGLEQRGDDPRNVRRLVLGHHAKPALLPGLDDRRCIDEQAAHGRLGTPRVRQRAVDLDQSLPGPALVDRMPQDLGQVGGDVGRLQRQSLGRRHAVVDPAGRLGHGTGRLRPRARPGIALAFDAGRACMISSICARIAAFT